MTTARTVSEDSAVPSQCWCCGAVGDPTRMVHLGRHPEVSVCAACARWAAKQAWELDDQSKTGPLVRVRDRCRSVRQTVIRKGWHHNRVIGAPLRWIGKHTP